MDNTSKSSTSSDNIDDILKNLDIQLANLEKFGSALLIVGYSLFFYGADLDIKETLDINNTGLTPTGVTLYGGELVLYGYILLFIVADRRLNQKIFENDELGKDNILSPYYSLYDAYFISILMNLIRLDALIELDQIDRLGDTFV